MSAALLAGFWGGFSNAFASRFGAVASFPGRFAASFA